MIKLGSHNLYYNVKPILFLLFIPFVDFIKFWHIRFSCLAVLHIIIIIFIIFNLCLNLFPNPTMSHDYSFPLFLFSLFFLLTLSTSLYYVTLKSLELDWKQISEPWSLWKQICDVAVNAMEAGVLQRQLRM